MNNVEYFNLPKNVLLIEKYYLYGQNDNQYSTSHYRPHKKKQLEVTLPIPIQKINEDFHIKKLKQKKQKKYNIKTRPPQRRHQFERDRKFTSTK